VVFLTFFLRHFFAATAILMNINYGKKAENVLNLIFSAQMQNDVVSKLSTLQKIFRLCNLKTDLAKHHFSYQLTISNTEF
jgi:hypothetical protein